MLPDTNPVARIISRWSLTSGGLEDTISDPEKQQTIPYANHGAGIFTII